MRQPGNSRSTRPKLRLRSALLACVLGLAQVQSASAQIVNDVTATGSVNGSAVAVTASETVSVIPADPRLSLLKTGVFNDGGDGKADVGDTIAYKFSVSNAGNVSVNNVSISDPLVTVNGGPLTVLLPGSTDSSTFTAIYALTQADIDAGQVANVATVNGIDPSGNPLTALDGVTMPLVSTTSLTLDKAGTLNDGGDGRADAGDTILYQFIVTNTGPTTLSNVTITDPLLDLAARAAPARALARINLDDLAAAPIQTASLGLRPAVADSAMQQPENRPPVAQFTTDVLLNPTLVPSVPTGIAGIRRLVQLSGGVGSPKIGDRIGVLYSLTNTGDAPLTGLTVHEAGSDVFGNSLDYLAPGDTNTGEVMFTRVLTEDDLAAGLIDAPAVIAAESRNRKLLAGIGTPMPLSGIEHVDTLQTATISPTAFATLLPGAQAVFSATYTLTQADIDAGLVDNTATASALDPGGATIVSIDTATVPLNPLPSIALVKTGSADLGADAVAGIGDLVTYQFTVTNTGNVTLTNIAITDPLVTIMGGPVASLAPGDSDSATFTATHALTQADLDAGGVTNQATASGTPPNGNVVTDLSDDADINGGDPTVTTLTPASAIALVKTVATIVDVNGNGVTDQGDQLNYAFTVTNTGNVTLTNIAITDPLVTVAGGPLAALAPGVTDSTTFTAAYVLTQADADAGKVSNQATVTATDPSGATLTDLSDPSLTAGNTATETPIPPAPALALVKAVGTVTDVNANGVNDPGDVINYTFTLSNTGNVTLSNLTVTDPLVQVSGGPLASLAPSASDATTFTASYVITLADAAAGRVTNQATASATTPGGLRVSDQSDDASADEDDPTITPVTILPSIALVKTVTAISDVNGNALTDAGDTIGYAFAVTNTGNVTLTQVTITDPLVAVTGGPISTLGAGKTDTTTFTAIYTISDADVALGRVTNQATAFGTSPLGTVVNDLSDGESTTQNDPTVTVLSSAPAIALVKTVSAIVDQNGNGLTDAGDSVNYAFIVTNTGNVTLTNISISDPRVTVQGGPIASLSVSQSDGTTFTASYLITQADMDVGRISNQAVATGTTAGGVLVSDQSDDASTGENDATETPLNGTPGIAVVKTVGSIDDRNGNGETDAGDILHYAFAVTNTGNVTLSNVALSDPLVPVTGGPLATLAAGATDASTFTAAYSITTADALAGRVSNQALATALTPSGGTVTDQSDDDSATGNDPTVTPVLRLAPSLSKTALVSEVWRGQRVPYVIVAAHAGSGPLDIVDIMPPGFSFAAGSATANGTPVKPVITGRLLSFTALTPDAAETITVKLSLIAATTASGGRQINRAELRDTATGTLLATAQAAVTIVEEHVFDCGEVIGRVFDDRNRNGYADDGEPGLPAVRVATVKGLLVTTDKHGRFHVPCAGIPDALTGSNFLMKLDTRTLPTGYVVTSENPRDVRLTRGKVTKLNFGASILRQVRLDLKDAAFTAGAAELTPEWKGGVGQLIGLLGEEPSVLNLSYLFTAPSDLARRRLAAVKALIAREWQRQDGTYRLVIDARALSVE